VLKAVFTLAKVRAIALATATAHSHYFLALATLGDATEIASRDRIISVYVAPPKVAKACTVTLL
jgi:hypothetical protein